MLFIFGNHGTGLRDPSRGFFIFTPVSANTGIIHLKNEAKQDSNLHHSWTKVLSKAWLLEVSSYNQTKDSKQIHAYKMYLRQIYYA